MKVKALILCGLILSGCATENQRRKICASCPSSDTIRLTERYEVRKDSFIIEADSAFYYALLQCRDGKVEIEKILAEINGKRTQIKASVDKNNVLKIQCLNDSLLHEIEIRDKIIENIKQSTKRVEIPVDKRSGFERFVDSFSGLLFAILAGVIGVMLIFWALFKRKFF